MSTLSSTALKKGTIPEEKSVLQDFRQHIDAIDDQILQLLIQRTQIVKDVGTFKSQTQASDKSFIRPGREAEMLRDLIAKTEGPFPKEAIVAIWRMIISASLGMECDFNIAVLTAEADDRFYWHTREYFGSFTPIKSYQTIAQVLNAVNKGKASVAILPAPTEHSGGMWWQTLTARGNKLKVFARIPFIQTKGKKEPTLFALANVEPEPTSSDMTLFSIECDEHISQSRLARTFSQAKLDIRWLTSPAQSTVTSDKRCYLVEAEGFVKDDDDRLRIFKESLPTGTVQLTVAGAYATPLILS